MSSGEEVTAGAVNEAAQRQRPEDGAAQYEDQQDERAQCEPAWDKAAQLTLSCVRIECQAISVPKVLLEMA